jgi:hypothetical protein
MSELSNSLTILVLVCIAIGAIVSIVTLTLLYLGLPFFGPVNDYINAIVGVFIGLLAWQFFAKLPSKFVPGIVGLVFAWIGVTLVIGNSVLVALGRMEWREGGMYTGLGYGLIGIWLLITLISSSLAGVLTDRTRLDWVPNLVLGPLQTITVSVGVDILGKDQSDPNSVCAMAWCKDCYGKRRGDDAGHRGPERDHRSLTICKACGKALTSEDRELFIRLYENKVRLDALSQRASEKE